MGQGRFGTLAGCGLVRRRREVRDARVLHSTLGLRGVAALRLTGFEVSVGAGSLSVVGGEAVLLATGASTMGASAVWLSVEVMAMALVGSACAGSGGVRRGYFPLDFRWISFSRSISSLTQTL